MSWHDFYRIDHSITGMSWLHKCVYNTVLASHIDTSVLSDGTYELIQESEGGDPEVQVNTAVLTETPDQSLEEPRAELVSDY